MTVLGLMSRVRREYLEMPGLILQADHDGGYARAHPREVLLRDPDGCPVEIDQK